MPLIFVTWFGHVRKSRKESLTAKDSRSNELSSELDARIARSKFESTLQNWRRSIIHGIRLDLFVSANLFDWNRYILSRGYVSFLFSFYSRVESFRSIIPSRLEQTRQRCDSGIENYSSHFVFSRFLSSLNLRSLNGSFSSNLLRKRDRSTFVSIPFFLVEHDRSISSHRLDANNIFTRYYHNIIAQIITRYSDVFIMFSSLHHVITRCPVYGVTSFRIWRITTHPGGCKGKGY